MDIRELKNYIYDNHYIEQILKSIGCHHIKYHSNYWTCGNKDGDNTKSIVIRNNEFLGCENYTRQMINTLRATDLIDLVCFNQGCSFPDAINFICNEIGLSYYHDFNEDVPECFKILKLLDDLDTGVTQQDEIPLKKISESILNYYKPYVNDLFLEDNISYETQREFEIGFDEESNRFTIPIRSELGDLIGVKGRYFYRIVPDNENKYMYLEPCPKSKIIYGLYKTINFIKETGIIYVGESEKFTQQLWCYGYRNGGSTGGKELSNHQIDMLIRLGVKICFCFDKDVTKDEYEELASRFPEGVPLYYMFDENGILNEKESPSDNPIKWKCLKENNIYKLR